MSLQRQDPKGNLPFNPAFNPAGGAPQYGMPGQMPMGMPTGMRMGQPGMPGQMPMGQQMPGQMGQPFPPQMPGQMMGPQAPGMMYGPPGQQMPGQMMGQQMPGQMMGQQMPGQMGPTVPGQPMPGQMMGQQGPGQMGQQVPGQVPSQMGQQGPGQMGGVGMNPPLNPVPTQMGQPISLVKGQNMSITKVAPGMTHALIGLGWDVRQSPGAPFDLDASCFMLNAQNKVSSPQNFIFYNNKQSMDGSILHHGDNLTGAGDGDDEQVSVDLTRVPLDVQSIVFVASIYEAETRGQNFGMVQKAFIRVVDKDANQEIVRYDLSEEACMWNCMIFGELYRHSGEWKFKAHGQGEQGGLRGIGTQYGMQLA